MKKLFWIISALLSITAYSQDTANRAIPVTGSPMILFQYDTAGNQIVRSLCINCPLVAQKNTPASEEEELPFEKFFPKDEISYYPNPVKEELYLKWDLVNNNNVNSIQIYSLNGQLLKSYKNLGKTNNEKISFQEFASGIYTVLLQCSNGEHQSIKIIKQ